MSAAAASQLAATAASVMSGVSSTLARPLPLRRAPTGAAVSDARAWTHGCAGGWRRALRADAGAGAHAGRVLTHLAVRAVER